MSRRIRTLPLLLLIAFALGGCGGGRPVDAPGTQATATTRPAVIGAVLMQQDQFFRLNEAGMRAAATRLGVELKVQTASGALDKEIAIVETFTTQKVDAILISPLSSEGSVPALRRATEAGIAIVTYNNALAGDLAAFAIASDQTSLGATSGEAARSWIETHRDGTARVALIGFASQLPEQGGARQDGFKSAIAGMPGVTIVAEQDAWEAAQATTAVGELLAKQPDLIWAANEGGTVGAVTAVRNAGAAGRVVVFGTDLSAQLLDFLSADDGILQAVTAQAPVAMGDSAVEAAVRVIRSQPIEQPSVLPGKLYARTDPDSIVAARASLVAAGP